MCASLRVSRECLLPLSFATHGVQSAFALGVVALRCLAVLPLRELRPALETADWRHGGEAWMDMV